jgi:2-dehydro-3-deoxygalactonokinase
MGGVRLWGDWGSSNLRVYRCDADGIVQGERNGPGVAQCDNFEATFFDVIGDWADEARSSTVFLSGMVGSTLGWHDAPYLACPATIPDLGRAVLRFEARGQRFAIVPGLRCTNIFGLPDVLRGEEMQLLGWADVHGAGMAQRTICLPGTHTKWAQVDGGRVTAFFTSLQGEIRAALLGQGLIGKTLGPDAAKAATDHAEFDRGVAAMVDPTLSIEHAVFSTRSRIVLGDLAVASGASYLTGLLIGAEVRDGRAAHRARGLSDNDFVLIATPLLTDLYARALAAFDCRSEVVDGAAMALRGMMTLAAQTEALA